jgi:hypothetical protein
MANTKMNTFESINEEDLTSVVGGGLLSGTLTGLGQVVATVATEAGQLASTAVQDTGQIAATGVEDAGQLLGQGITFLF